MEVEEVEETGKIEEDWRCGSDESILVYFGVDLVWSTTVILFTLTEFCLSSTNGPLKLDSELRLFNEEWTIIFPLSENEVKVGVKDVRFCEDAFNKEGVVEGEGEREEEGGRDDNNDKEVGEAKVEIKEEISRSGNKDFWRVSTSLIESKRSCSISWRSE